MADDGIIEYVDSNDPELKVPVVDGVWAYRNLLLDGHGSPKRIPEVFKNMELEMAQTVYPYTKGPDFANDLLAYGERVLEFHRFVDQNGKRLDSKARVSRRTRSGRTPERANLMLPQPPKGTSVPPKPVSNQ